MIHFVGAGPGDTDLITVKGRRLLERADVVIYAGSLVAKEHMEVCREGCEIYNSASMTLEEVLAVMKDAHAQGRDTVRLHTGDPSIYGAIREQMDALDALAIPYEVIPGVSSFTAAAAAISKEFTLPGVSQTIILTRMEGRTPVPEKENLRSLASHRASMAIFLSIAHMERLVEELAEGYGRRDVPVAVVYKASYVDQRILYGTLDDIAPKVREAGIKNMAQILVGDFLADEYERSRLYDPAFSHAFRKGTDAKRNAVE